MSIKILIACADKKNGKMVAHCWKGRGGGGWGVWEEDEGAAKFL